MRSLNHSKLKLTRKKQTRVMKPGMFVTIVIRLSTSISSSSMPKKLTISLYVRDASGKILSISINSRRVEFQRVKDLHQMLKN